MGKSMRKRKLVASGLLVGLSLGCFTSDIHADAILGEFYYTVFSGQPNVKKRTFTYDGGTNLTISGPTVIATTNGADGIVFAADGDLLVGGQGDRIHKVDPGTGTVQTRTAGGIAGGSFHVTLDPSGTKAWTAGIPGQLAEVPVSPTFSNGIAHTLSGDDTQITSIAFDNSGQAYYTSSGSGGVGSVGKINLTTFVTQRFLSNVAAAHGMAFDSFTGDLMIFGDSHISQIDTTTMAIVSDRAFTGVTFDQGAVDAKGHAFVADNNGSMLFVDYKNSGFIGSASNFTSLQFLEANLDDIAPLSGPGANPVPLPAAVWGGAALMGGMVIQRMRRDKNKLKASEMA